VIALKESEREYEEEQLFLDRLAHRIWKARKEGVTIGAGFVLGVSFLTYLILDVGLLNPVAAFLYAGIGAMAYTLWSKVFRDP